MLSTELRVLTVMTSSVTLSARKSSIRTLIPASKKQLSNMTFEPETVPTT